MIVSQYFGKAKVQASLRANYRVATREVAQVVEQCRHIV